MSRNADYFRLISYWNHVPPSGSFHIGKYLILKDPAVSVMLWLFLLIVAFVWKETLSSLTSKLMAKANILREMEEQQLVSFPFLIKERTEWEALARISHQGACCYRINFAIKEPLLKSCF